MNWNFRYYPSVLRAFEIAEEGGLKERTARNALYGLLRIAEDEGLADTQLSSEQVLQFLNRALPRKEHFDPLPQVEYPNSKDPGQVSAWLDLFEPVGLGWKMWRAVGVEPGQALFELRRSQAPPISWWASDAQLLMELVSQVLHPVGRMAMHHRVSNQIFQWLQPLLDEPKFPARSAPEPPLSELIALLGRLSSIALIYWAYGLTPPVYRGRLTMKLQLSTGWAILPGGAYASQAEHSVVYPIHQLLAGLSESRFQLDFAYARRALERHLEQLNFPRNGLDAPWASDEALPVLQKYSEICSLLRVEPAPIHLALAALQEPDPFLTRALADVETERLRVDLERVIFGRLPDASLAIDGRYLDSRPEDLGPLRQISSQGWQTESGSVVELDDFGRIGYLGGATLTSQGIPLLNLSSRPHQAEELLGFGRLERWTPVFGAELRVKTHQGSVQSISLRRT